NQDITLYYPVENMEIVEKLGFSFPIIENEAIVPKPINKPTKINLDGYEIIRKDLPKEKYPIYYSFEAPNFGDSSKGTHLVEGYFEREKYKREHTNPFELKLVLLKKDEKFYVSTEEINFSDENEDKFIIL